MQKTIHEFLGVVSVNFRRSRIAYDNYLQGGKRYIHARVLRECNEQIRSALLENSFLLPADLIEHALELIAHYDIWLKKWYDLERRQAPGLGDEFVFQNTAVFPREAEKALMDEFLRIHMELK